MSQLQAPDNPFVIITIVPTCGTRKCRDRAELIIQDFRNEQQKHDAENACKVCGKYAGSQPCKKCKSVSYCSEQHRKEDWLSHKKACEAKSEGEGMAFREMLEATAEAEQLSKRMKRMTGNESIQVKLQMQADLEDIERRLEAFTGR
jgi:hypothetical protein